MLLTTFTNVFFRKILSCILQAFQFTYLFKSVMFIRTKKRLWLLFNICAILARTGSQLPSIAGSLHTLFLSVGVYLFYVSVYIGKI